MNFANEFIIVLITSPSSLDSFPEHGFPVTRTHSCGRNQICFAKDKDFAKEFDVAVPSSFVLIIVMRECFPPKFYCA